MALSALRAARDWFENYIDKLLLANLAVNLLVLILTVYLVYDHSESVYIFYLFCITYKMVSTIYFAWSSVRSMQLVKENAFELISFMIMSSILNMHAIYALVKNCNIKWFQYLGIGVFSTCQLFYFSLYYFAFKKFGWRVYKQLKTTDADMLSNSYAAAFKLFENCKSILKLDAFLYMLGMATYDYYMFDDPSNDRLQGILITVISCILLLTYTLLGLLSVFYTQLAKEMKKLFIFILGISPILAGIKVYILVMLIQDRGEILTEYILVQSYVTSKL